MCEAEGWELIRFVGCASTLYEPWERPVPRPARLPFGFQAPARTPTVAEIAALVVGQHGETLRLLADS